MFLSSLRDIITLITPVNLGCSIQKRYIVVGIDMVQRRIKTMTEAWKCTIKRIALSNKEIM